MKFFKHNQPDNYIKILDYTYTSQPSINSALPLRLSKIKLVLFLIACVVTLGFVWLLAKWSSKKKAIFLYNVCDIEEATNFLILEQDQSITCAIVARINKFDVKRRINAVCFVYHDRKFLYHQEKQVFLPIRFQDLGILLDRLQKNKYQPYSRRTRTKLLDYYGINQIVLDVQNYLQAFIEQMLTPYEVFQLYAIILWITEQYYIFSVILLVYSLYTYWDSSRQIVQNQRVLAQRSYFSSTCKVITRSKAYENEHQNDGGEQEDKITIIGDEHNQEHASIIQQNLEQIHSARSRDHEILTNPKKQQVTIMDQLMDSQQIQPKQKQKRSSSSSVSSSLKTKTKDNKHSKRKIQVQTIQSKNIIPGDIIILKQGDVIPCDCVIVLGQAVIDQSFISGEKYLIRKYQLDNYQYSKDKQQAFLLYFGTKIVKVKTYLSVKSQFNKNNVKNKNIFGSFVQDKEIVCIVTQTNYNTQRGKYLRAVRYQKKPIDNFTRESIYFIYIIIAITVISFAILCPFLYKGQTSLAMFVLFLDLLATSIPITLPTALSVGIKFAQHRLAKAGINYVLPSNILQCGRASTLVLDANKILSKNYQVSSIVVGIKNKSIGNTYSSLSQFIDMTCPSSSQSLSQFSQSYMADPQKKKAQLKAMHKSGRMLLRAFSTCHALQKYNQQLSGTAQQKHLFQFAESVYVDQDYYECLGEFLRTKERIYYKEKDKKLAVIVQLENRKNKTSIQQGNLPKKYDYEIQQAMLEQNTVKPTKTNHKNNSNSNKKMEQQQTNQSSKYIFIKGPAQQIIKICKQGTYPLNYQDYIVDIAEKGFKVLCFAYKAVPDNFNSAKSMQYLHQQFIFCGFALLQTEKMLDTIDALQQLKNSKLQIILMSGQKALQTSSLAISNKICTKNQLILCDLVTKQNNQHYQHDRMMIMDGSNKIVKCTGHVQWQSGGSGNSIHQFIMESESILKGSYLSLTSKMYEQLFMKKDQPSTEYIFKKTIIYNEMENRHVRNVYFQLDKRKKITLAVGSGANVSQCAHLSLELEKGQCSMLSSFYTKQKSLGCITNCLIICRAALATNFHCFSMMILFSMVQFTTVINLYYHHQNLSDFQMLYEDLFVTFPIFVTINLTSPVSKLSKQLPPVSFFDRKPLASMVGQFLIQLVTQICFITYIFNLNFFKQEMEQAEKQYYKQSDFIQTNLTLATFILTNYLYLGIVLSTSVSGPFRKPFYTNPYYTITLAVLWMYNTAIVLMPEIVPNAIREKDNSQEVEQVLVMAMLLGNLMMIVMYLYENCLVWISSIVTKVNQGKRNSRLGIQMQNR